MDSPAENSDVQVGDEVLRVNGLDVTMATAECVSKLVRHSQPLMTLTVHRYASIQQSDFSSNSLCVSVTEHSHIMRLPQCTVN